MPCIYQKQSAWKDKMFDQIHQGLSLWWTCIMKHLFDLFIILRKPRSDSPHCANPSTVELTYRQVLKNMLTRRKESNIYLATVSRRHWSLQIMMKMNKMCSFQPALRPSSADSAMQVESYTFYPFSSWSAHSSDVYWQ